MADRRDELTWVALELSRAGEMKVEEGTLDKSIRRDLDLSLEFPIFIPSMTFRRNGRNVTLHLMEGYAFVATGLPETSYFALAKRTVYVNQVMSTRSVAGMSVLSVIDNSYIEELKEQIRTLLSATISVGEKVRVLGGIYSSLEGEVLALEKEEAIIHIQLRSLNVVTKINKMFLEPAENEEDDCVA